MHGVEYGLGTSKGGDANLRQNPTRGDEEEEAISKFRLQEIEEQNIV